MKRPEQMATAARADVGVAQGTRALVFDVEGTLIDCIPQTLESWRLTLRDDGHELTTSDLQPYSGMDGRDMLKELLPKLPTARVQRLLKAQGERYRQDFIQTTHAFDGVREVFARLKRAGFPIAIATTCQRDELTVYNTFMHVLDLTDAVVCGDDIKHGKPHPDLLRRALGKLKWPEPARALAIGDTPYDAKSAIAAGMGCVGVLSGGFSRAGLESAGCDDVLHTLSDLIPYLEASSARTASLNA